MKANLHVHTKYSDGNLSLQDAFEMIAKSGITIFAKTDHNTAKGCDEAKRLCDARGWEFFAGEEMTTYHDSGVVEGIDSTCAVHVLGLGVDVPAAIEQNVAYEAHAMGVVTELVQKLNRNGYKVSLDAVLSSQKFDRTQVARELVNTGAAWDVCSAYDMILNTDEYFEYSRFPFCARDTIESIHRAGGLAVWAHPYLLKRGGSLKLEPEQTELMLRRLVSYGLDGLEACYMQFDECEVDFLLRLAKKYNLYASVGTDFHGRDIREDGLLEKSALIERYTEICLPLIEELRKRSGSRG